MLLVEVNVILILKNDNFDSNVEVNHKGRWRCHSKNTAEENDALLW